MPINPAFDFVNGYPDDWEARRQCIHERDRDRCQVTGCLNTMHLDVHHIVPINMQPDHRIENLVLLCRFHHAMLPEHDRLVQEHDNRYSLVRAHWRWNPSGTERINVNATVRRYPHGRVTEQDMKELFEGLDERYVIECKHCQARDWKIKVRTDIDRVTVYCMKCWRAWLYERGLREEIGVQLFQTALFARQRQGRFTLSLDKLCVRAPVEPHVCEYCRALDRLSVLEKKYNNRDNRKFLGCETWKTTGCQCTDPWHDGDENRVW